MNKCQFIKMMMDVEDLWRDKIEKKQREVKDLTNKVGDWVLEASDYTDMEEDEEDSDADMNN